MGRPSSLRMEDSWYQQSHRDVLHYTFLLKEKRRFLPVSDWQLNSLATYSRFDFRMIVILKKLPILDMKVHLSEVLILYEHYKKEVSTKLVIAERSAHSGTRQGVKGVSIYLSI